MTNLEEKPWYRILQVLFAVLCIVVFGVSFLILSAGHYVGSYPSGSMQGYDISTWGLTIVIAIIILAIIRAVVLYILTGKFDR